MLKQEEMELWLKNALPAAFGRLCVETTSYWKAESCARNQPPSGGCVLKPTRSMENPVSSQPAAFGRLCVETEACSSSD